MQIELMPHQKTAVYKMDNGKILCGGTGSGKTIAGIAYYIEFEAPRDIYVITAAKKRDDLDWESEAAYFGIGKTREATLHGVLTVDSWNNIGKYIDVKDAFFVFDEQRVVGSGAWVKHFKKIARHNRWIMLSATPGDSWLDYIPVFVANGFYENTTAFKAEHVIYDPYSKYPKVQRYVNVQKLMYLRRQILVDMPFDRHTIRHTHVVEVDWNRDLFRKVVDERWNPFTDEPIRNVSELFVVMRRVVNTDESRFHALKRLLEKHPRLIVFYNHDPELMLLRTAFEGLSREDSSSGTVTFSEWNGHRHDPVPTTPSWVYLVQYSAGSEAWNCITTDAMVFFSLTYSWRQFDQSYGRIDRLNTTFKDLQYYVLRSSSPIDRAIWRALDEKRNFNERAFVRENIESKGI